MIDSERPKSSSQMSLGLPETSTGISSISGRDNLRLYPSIFQLGRFPKHAQSMGCVLMKISVDFRSFQKFNGNSSVDYMRTE